MIHVRHRFLLLVLAGFITVLLFTFDFFARTFSLYFIVPWADLVAHFFGGVAVGFGIRSLLFYVAPMLEKRKHQAITLLGVFGVGAVWEVFEYVTNQTVVRGERYVADTTLDLIMDLLGGVIVLLL